jgi:putative ABC transport system substrate-binding protein
MFSDENLVKIENEISEILKVGENKYLGMSNENMGKKYLIGVTRIMQHKDLITKQDGFKAAIEEAGYIEGKIVQYDIQDTLADVEKIVQVSNKFIKDKAALIHCLSITGTMILLENVKDLPVVGYAVYAGDPTTMGYEATNVTGIMVKSCPLQNLWPVKSQLEMYLKFIPGKKKWGTVYNSGSANTRFHMEELRDVSDDLGVEIVEASVSKPSEVRTAAQSLVGKVDAIYITSDEMSMSKFDDIVELCNKNKIPLFGGEFECVKKGAIAAYDVNYFKIGYIAGKQAVRILKGEKPKDINPEFYTKLDLHISLENAKKQGIIISEELEQLADKKL